MRRVRGRSVLIGVHLWPISPLVGRVKGGACKGRKFSENSPVLSPVLEKIAALELPGKVWVGSAPREPVRLLASGVAGLDTLLGGGVPRGELSEITGAPSSGRTGLVLTLVAAATRGDEVAAVIDLPDALYPPALESAAARLDRILWVRPPSLPTALKGAELILDAGGFGVVVLDLDGVATSRLPHHVWPRLRRVARRSGAALLVLAPHRVAGANAALSLQLKRRRTLWSRTLFDGFDTQPLLLRGRGR